MFPNQTCAYAIILILVNHVLVQGVQFGLKGSLRFGQDVLHTFKQLMSHDNSRRSLSNNYTDNYEELVKTSNLCYGVKYCDDKLKLFLEKYVQSLANSMKSIAKEVIEKKNLAAETGSKVDIKHIKSQFNNRLNCTIKAIKAVLNRVNVTSNKYTEEELRNIIKTISGMFQKAFFKFLIKNNISDQCLKQKIVYNSASIEFAEENNMCKQLVSCKFGQKVSVILIKMFQGLLCMPDDKIYEFLASFHKELFTTPFYLILDKNTAIEFENILHDMAFTTHAPTKEVLTGFAKSVKSQFKVDNNNVLKPKTNDVQLLYLILSDLDYIFENKKEKDFRQFMEVFERWRNNKGIKLNVAMRKVMGEIMEHLFTLSGVLFEKLKNEVRTFLEITVSPDKI